MNRHDSYQQPEATADNANARQWQVDLSEQDTGKVGNDSDAGGANGGKNTNDANRTSDQGETVEVRVIKGDRDEPNDRSSWVEQGSQDSQTAQTDTEAQPKKRGMIELLGSSQLGVMAQTALDSVRHSVHEIQVDRQIKLIDKTARDRSTEEQERCSQLNRLVDEDRVKLRDGRVLKEYLSRVSYLDKDGSNTNFINKLIQENKVDLSRPDVREAYLKVALSTELNSERLGVQEAINTGKLDLSNEEIADQFLGAMSQSVAFNTSMLKESSISPERIVNNDHIQEIAVEQMVSVADRVHNGKDAKSPIFSQYWYQTVTDDGAYLADVLEKVCSSEEGRQCLVDSINKSGASVQELGEPFEKMETDILEEIARRRARIERGRPSLNADLTEDTLSDVDELFANMATDMTKYNDVLKGLGWEPFKKDESLAKLFCTSSLGLFTKKDKMSIEVQDGAYKLGLITPGVTDRLYNYQFKELFNATKRGSILGYNDNSSAYAINPDLVPSGEDVKANYWYEQSKLLGDDVMRLCMAKALDMTEKEQDDGQRLDLSDLIDEDGTLKDAFFQNRPGSFLQDVYNAQETYHSCDGEECAKVIRFLEAHKDQASEADGSKVLVDLLGKMKNENGGYDMKAITDLQRLTDLTYNYTELFDANGPKPEVWQDAFSRGGYLAIFRYSQNQDEVGKKRMGLDDKQIAVVKGYGSISEGDDWNDSRKLFESYVREHYDELTIDQIKWTASIMARLANSNASELADRSEAFARELLKLDTDKIPEALDKIEDIYIHNHLPYVGKNYLVFRTMHPSPNLEDDFNFNNGRISPVLQQATGDLKSGKLDQMLNSRDAIIVSDLLRASLGSNNRSIREYLATLKNGQSLLDQLSSGELDWSAFNQPTSLMDKDTKANYDTLSTFAWHLATIYNSTLPGKEHPYQLMHQQSGTDEPSAQPNALQADFANLTSLIKPNSRYSLADRSVRYFAHFVGIEDLAGAEQYMDNVVKEADARNRRTAEYLTNTDEPKLQPGDLVKGMGGTVGDGIRYLSYAFQNGSISKEYLGDASRSDTTPLDADASIVPDQLNGQTINQIMNGWDRYMLANSYGGGLWVVLRPDNDRFIVTRRGKDEADQSVYDLSVPDANFDRTDLTQEEIDRRLKEIAEAKRHRREGLPKLEIFATGVDGDGHYGVRTGFGMNLVSFCVTDSTLRDSTPVSEVTKLEIALDGFYIPVVDRDSEELIFTPADYDKMRRQMSGLSYYRTGEYQFAPDSELELGELTLDKESLSAVSAPTTSSTSSSSSSTSDDAQGASSGSITIPSTSTIISELPAGMAETDHKHEVINQVIKQAITSIPELNLSYKDYLDGDLTENIVEMIDTGSTGRQTNAPGLGDFDYLARLDRSILNDPTKKQQITDALLAAFGRENDGSAIVNGNLRLKQVSIDGLAEPVDIDITFAQKTNKVQYPTDAALADRLSNIKNQSEAKYQQVLANIIYAKQFLKAAGAYKPRRSPEAKGIGGLGGVGIENWVLQHGGSFKQAARDFLAVADNCSGFEDFCAYYPVWDYGENHKGIRSKPHDNFVADNMNPEGYERMKEALRAVVN